MDPNSLLGWLLIILGVLALLLAFVIGVRKFVIAGGAANPAVLGSGDIFKLLIELLKEVLKAPPAIAFLVIGVLLVGGGTWVLSARPIEKAKEKANAKPAAVSHIQMPAAA